ncbi:MAG: segregation and condensation protein A [Verrucomicrobiales bacterium]
MCRTSRRGLILGLFSNASNKTIESTCRPDPARQGKVGTIAAVAFEVETQVFNGPFDLLLHLILAEEVELYEISLTTIVDAYLTELEKMEHIDLEVATEFLLIAATLVELKARRLLPDDDSFDLDEELALFEERDLLLSRLVECKTFKDAAGVIRQLHDAGRRTYPRVAGMEEQFLGVAPDMLEGIDVDDLRAACIRALMPRPEPVLDLYHVSAATASVSDAVREFVDELPGAGVVSFRDLTSGLVDRIEVVVRFLAVLELFKQGLVDIVQARAFGDIQLEWIGGDPDDALSALAIDRYDG